MQPDTNGGVIDRIIAWLRGLFSAGKGATGTATRDVRRTAHEATDTVRDGVGDAERKVRDIADRREAGSATTGDRNRSGPPDLADEPSGGGRSTFDTGTSSRSAASTYSTGQSHETSDADVDLRSDFDDAAGDEITGDETYPPAGADLASATHVHDAVGGEDEFADDTTDGRIDTTRDADLRAGGAEGLQDRDISLQDQLIVDEGASSDEFDGDEITPGNADNPYVTTEDVESAAEGYGDTDNTDLANTSAEGTSSLTGSTYTEADDQHPIATPDESRSFQVVERYNYGVGDLGVGAGTTPDRAWDHDAGPDVSASDIDTGVDADINAAHQGTVPAGSRDADTDALDRAADATATADIDASVSPEATRTEIESQSRGDAVNRSDEATQTPGFGAPETFASAAAGTTEPSRSATGDDVDSDQDALGTTLDYSEESDAFDEEAADLSGEDELAVSDENVDFGAERVATFQSGTIAQQGGLASGDVAIDEQVTNAAYADLPDEPEPATADDAGEDDLAGSDYPSDRVVDWLDGDDFTDAETPDVPDLDSSAGDLDVVSSDPSAQVDYVTEPVERTVGDAGDRIDQDALADTDQTVGEDISPLKGSASRDVADLSAASGAAISGENLDSSRAGQAATGGRSAPAGSVPGDGGTEAPEGYPVKGNADSMIYHLPHYPSYRTTKAEFYFATEEDAIAAGYRAPGNIRRGHAAGDAAASAAAAVTGDTGAVTGDETSHAAPGEIAFDDRLSDDASGVTTEDQSAEAAVDTDVPEVETSESDADLPVGAVRGDGTANTPDGYPVKGNASSMIYHLPEFGSYRATKPELCFATEEDALNAGYRAPANAHRGGHVAGDAASSAASAAMSAEQEEFAGSEDTSSDTAASEAVASDAEVPAGAVRGDGGTEPPAGYPVKGNANSKIYHLPSFPSYKSTKAEFYFATEDEAIAAGYRAPGKRNRGKKH